MGIGGEEVGISNLPTQKELSVAIHRHCLACSGGSRKLVHACNITTCDLWLYREPETVMKPRKEKGQINIFDLVKEA